MLALSIISFILAIVVWIVAGFVCSRMCVEIIRGKNLGYNEFLWFWFGFFFTFIAVIIATVTKKNEDEE